MLFVLLSRGAFAADGVGFDVRLPKDAKAKSAVATAPALKLETPGKIDGQVIHFDNLLTDTAYDVRVTLDDGTILQGVDLAWYDLEPAKKDAGEPSDEDRKQINSLVSDIPRFYNKNEILSLSGDHDRAVGLVRLLRDKEFYGNSGEEIVWRIEVWYFKNQYGGWEAVSQQNKVLRRERFKTRAAFREATEKLKWTPALGGVHVPKGRKERLIITLPESRPSA